MMVALPPPPDPTIDAIYAAYEADAGDGLRLHLGASRIGDECRRALWLEFRWATPARHSGRMLRLFETGQLEEARLVRNLRRIGATVLEVDPETGRQWRVEAHGGHFGGSLDGVAIGIPEAPKTWHALEFKTHSAKSFAELTRQHLQAAKPMHSAQIQIYLHLTGLTRALYLAVCKDTDALYAERVVADPAVGAALLLKAERIIHADRPPERLSNDPSAWPCRLCPQQDVCFAASRPARSCRSCLHVTPIESGWHCARWDRQLSPADQRQGCDRHLYIPDLIAGDPIAVEADQITYRQPDGQLWTDGKAAS